MSHNGSSDSSSYVDDSWASWFCNLSGNAYFCEIERSYMEDSFNLFGLKQYLPKHYNKALDSILDRLNPNEPETEELSRSAVLLYGLIHARYIITSHGLEAMHRKYINKDFGECPRMLCRGQAVVPMGFTDDPKHGMVKLFCPKCRDVYNCHSNQRHIDGAFFGPTFPNLFFMTYEGLVPGAAMEQFVPRVFGFRIHPISNSLPKHHSAVTDFNVGNGALVGKNVGVSDFGGKGLLPAATETKHAPTARAKSVFLKAKTTPNDNTGAEQQGVIFGVATSEGNPNLGLHGAGSAGASLSASGQAPGTDSLNSVSEETVNAAANGKYQAASGPYNNSCGAEEVSSESRKGSRKGSSSGSGYGNDISNAQSNGHRHTLVHNYKTTGRAGDREISGRPSNKREKEFVQADEEDEHVKRIKPVVQ